MTRNKGSKPFSEFETVEVAVPGDANKKLPKTSASSAAILVAVSTTCIPPPHWIPSRLITMKNKIAATPHHAGEIDKPIKGERNCPKTTATPAVEPGPLTHISIQIFKKPQNGPKPARM